MTLFGTVWILILFYCCLKKNDRYIIFFLMLSGVLQCNNVFVINEIVGVGPFIITSIIFIVRYIFYNYKRYKISNKVYTLICIYILLSIYISLMINNNINDKIVFFIQITIYLLCFIFSQKVSANIEEKTIIKFVFRIIDIVLVIGIIQYIIFIFGFSKVNILSLFIYNDRITPSIAYYATTRVRLFSTFMEPSYCGAFLVGALYFSCYYYNNDRKSTFRISMIFIAIILTKSTTAYVSAGICGLLFVLVSKKREALKILVLLSILGLIFTSITGIYETVIAKKLSSGSAAERNLWNQRAINEFILNPMFGTGYKTSRASSLLFSIASEQGFNGILAFSTLIFVNFRKLLKGSVGFNNNYGTIWFFAGVIIGQIIACPDLDFCVLWLSMYIYGFAYKNKRSV